MPFTEGQGIGFRRISLKEYGGYARLSFMSNRVRSGSQQSKSPIRTEEMCGFCGANIKRAREPLIFNGFTLGIFTVEKCLACGEIVFPNSAWKAIKRFVKTLNKTQEVVQPLTSYSLEIRLARRKITQATMSTIGFGNVKNYQIIGNTTVTVQARLEKPLLATSMI